MTSEKSLTSAPTKEEILARVEEDGIQFINLQFTDVMGIVKSVTIPSAVFEHVIDGGQWIDGSSIAGFTRIAESDMIMFHMWPMDGARGRTRMNTWKDLGLAPYIVVWGDERRFAGTS